MKVARLLGSAVLATAAIAPSAFATVTIADTGTTFAASGTTTVRLVDIDGDGHLDIVSGSSLPGGAVAIHLGDGAGGFTAPGGVTDQTAGSAVFVTVADADGDGRQDLITAGDGPAVSIWHRLTGPGLAFDTTPTVVQDPTIGDRVMAVEVADATGDGFPDLVIAGDTETRVSQGSAAHHYHPDSFNWLYSYPTGGLRIADITGDGTADLVAVSWIPLAPSVLITAPVVPGVGTGMTMSFFNRRIRDLAVADMDGDGDRDLLFAYPTRHTLGIAWNNGTGAFGLGVETAFSTDASPTQLAIADMDRDGRPDVVAATSAGPQLVPGSGASPWPFGTPVDPGTGLSGTEVAVGDIDEDGLPDLVSASEAGIDVRLNTTPVTGVLELSSSFGATLVGDHADRTLTLTNTGGATLTPGSPTVTGPDAAQVSLTDSTCTGALAPGASCTVSVRHSPTARGPLFASVAFPAATPTPDAPLTLALSGSGAAAGALTAPNLIDAGEVTVGATTTRTVPFTNTGDLALTPPAATTSGSPDWTITSNPCIVTLAGGQSCTITVAVTPTATGASEAMLHVGAVTTDLHATGIAAPVTGDRDPVTPVPTPEPAAPVTPAPATPAPTPAAPATTAPTPATAAPRIVGPPRITVRGPLRRGTHLVATAVAAGTPMATFTYRWSRCLGSRCTVAGIGSRHTVVAADAGRRLKVTVTARNVAGTATATSALTARVPLRST